MTLSNTPFVKYERIEDITGVKQLKDILEQDTEIFEKIDGGNCQVRKIEERLYAGSKANFLTGNIAEKVEWFGKFLGWMYSNHTLCNIPENVVVFGEWSGNHTIDYGQNSNQFFMLDIFNLNEGRFMRYKDSVSCLKRLEIENVRFLEPLAVGRIDKSTLDELLRKPSGYYHGPKEGVVIKDYSSNPQRFYKFLNEGFAEQRAKLFGRNDPFTEARIRKSVLRGSEEYGMRELTFRVLYNLIKDDIKKEAGKDYPFEHIKKRVRPILETMFKKEGIKFVPGKH